MAEFVELEAVDVDNSSSSSNRDEGEDVPSVTDNEFIDDSEQPQQSDYSYFTNVTRILNKTTMSDIETFEDVDARHYFDSDDDEDELHNFLNFEAKARLFRESLICPHGLENPDSFFTQFYMQFVISLRKK